MVDIGPGEESLKIDAHFCDAIGANSPTSKVAEVAGESGNGESLERLCSFAEEGGETCTNHGRVVAKLQPSGSLGCGGAEPSAGVDPESVNHVLATETAAEGEQRSEIVGLFLAAASQESESARLPQPESGTEQDSKLVPVAGLEAKSAGAGIECTGDAEAVDALSVPLTSRIVAVEAAEKNIFEGGAEAEALPTDATESPRSKCLMAMSDMRDGDLSVPVKDEELAEMMKALGTLGIVG